MPPLKPEKPTRIQPHRAAKTPPATQTKIVLTTGGDRVTKKSTTPKLGQKQLKSPIKGAASIPNKSIGDGEDGEDGEETVTENPFADVTPADIFVGNIISTGHHETFANLQNQDQAYRAKFVREAGDGCGYVHSKYRKFVIVALFAKHFVALPIYSKRFSFLDERGDHGEYAEILDSTLKSSKSLPRPRPICRGSTDNIWLWSTAYSTADRGWSRMDDNSVAWMTRPVAHGNKIRAKVVSKLDKESEERLLRWTRDCLLEGLEAGVREHLRVDDRCAFRTY